MRRRKEQYYKLPAFVSQLPFFHLPFGLWSSVKTMPVALQKDLILHSDHPDEHQIKLLISRYQPMEQ